MKRLFLSVMMALVVTLGMGTVAQAADTDKFTISNFKAEYYLGRDSENRSTLRARWTITANFPPEQNHGIAPVFVKDYDKHPTHFELRSVTDGAGNSLNYDWDGDELRIGDKYEYVSGKKTYVIEYTQRDVTKAYGDTGRDEFYWDVIGNEWRVPIEKTAVKVTLDDSIVAARRGQAFCYFGKHGSNKRCVAIDDKNELKFTAGSLQPREGVTVALGFETGTFSAYQQTLEEKLLEIWGIVQLCMIGAMMAAIVWLIFAYYRIIDRKRDLGAIVPEYLPPKEASVITSGNILRRTGGVKGSPMAAQLLDLAVRHYIKLYEVKPKTALRAAQYEIEIVKDMSKLRAEEREIIKDMFGGRGRLPAVGERLNLKKLQYNSGYAKRTMDDDKKLKELINGEYGLREVNAAHKKRFRRYALVFAVLTVVLVSPVLLPLPIIAYAMSFSESLTDKGLALRRYLLGLKMYIGVAEAERLAMLQSPEGAEKVHVDAGDPKQLIKLYERVLPYAVLFGQEKEWTKQLGRYYDNIGAQPDWYAGQGAFNAAMFASSMNSLSSAASSVSSYSSSSGGSSGGGFSGGGGGGGGGGGW